MALISSINEQKSIQNTIYLNADMFRYYPRENLWNIFRKYIYTDMSQVKNIEILDEDKRLIMNVNSMNIEGNREEIDMASIDECKFIIRNIGEESLVFVSSKIKVVDGTYTIVMTKDITYLKEERKENYVFFLWIDSIVTTILAIIMYVISKNITNPIEELTKVSNSIKSGEYSKRVKYHSTDEIGVLSANFNSMMQVIEEKIDELNDINDQKQRFIDSLTHEMKTPVTSIIGYSDLLMRGNISEEIKFKALNYINDQGRRLENLTNALIKLIMVKNEKADLESIPINELMSNAIRALEYKLNSKNIDIKSNMKNCKIIGNKSLIDILLNNILDNAIKASSKNKKIYIIGNINKDSKYELIIKDEGIGVGNEDLQRIKEPFYMADKSRNTSSKNLGLGLSICNEICMRINIEFHINSELNKGTTVKLIFQRESEQHEEFI